MGKLVEVAKVGYGAFTVAKTVVLVAKRPAWALRKFAVKSARAALLAGLKAAFGERWAANVIGRLSVAGKSREGSVALPVPAWLAKWALDPEGARLVEQVANDVMSAPFELVGYKLAHARIGYDEQTRRLTLGMRLGVIDMEATAAQAAVEATARERARGEAGLVGAAKAVEESGLASVARKAASKAAAGAVSKAAAKTGEAAAKSGASMAKAGLAAIAKRRSKGG